MFGRGGQRRALASPSAVLRGLRAPGKDGALRRAVPRLARPSGRTDARRSRVSVFVGAHDRQDAGGDGGISGVRRAEFGGAVVAIDFPEVADAALVDRAEVVFAVGIVVVGEGVEGANLLEQRVR